MADEFWQDKEMLCSWNEAVAATFIPDFLCVLRLSVCWEKSS